MKLERVRIVNCFGFGDTSADVKPQLLYILGRNSSGKTSLLDAINHLWPARVPQDHPRFENFRRTDGNPQIAGTFHVSAPPALDGAGVLVATLKARNVPAPTISEHKQLQNALSELTSIYSALTNEIVAFETFTLTKFASGRCQITAGEDFKVASDRRKAVDAILTRILPGGTFTAGSSNYPGAQIASADLDRDVAKVIPRIFYYNESYNLTEDLPDHLTTGTISRPPNGVTKVFLALLGSAEAQTLLTTNDPDDQDRLRQLLQHRATELATRITESSARLVEITLSLTPQGLQITMRTDRKKSFYRQMSDATKFLVAYHVYASGHEPGGILLFDEPSRGLHASAEQYVRSFLERLSEDNHVIVSTHSEHLIDTDHLDRIRLMQQDEDDRPTVLNNLRPPRDRQNYLLALQPVFDAIGLSYTTHVLTNNRVVMTEGLTDYLYVRAFQRLARIDPDYQLAPGRGEGTLLTIVPFMVSQGIALKMLLDGTSVKAHLQDAFGIPDEAILVILLQNRTCGIEDIFSTSDYRRVLAAAGYAVSDDDLANGNSAYAKTTNKRLVAQTFLNQIDQYTFDGLDATSRQGISSILDFCNDGNWWRLP
jgi:energy-coupling factor transporter ATP-binding protein EcfA2